MKNILDFLTVLKDNNNKDWFHANRKDYDEAKSDFEGFINKLIPAVSEFDKSIKFITAKECIFRINKDIGMGVILLIVSKRIYLCSSF